MSTWEGIFGGGSSGSSGSSGSPYQPGVFYPAIMLNLLTTIMYQNRDYITPFQPRSSITVGEIAYKRATASTANVYVGIYDFAGNLLTDCAADAEPTVGLHAVSTTPVLLDAGEWYWIAINAASSLVHGDNIYSADLEPQDWYTTRNMLGYAVDVGFDPIATAGTSKLSGFKSRSNAALPSTQTMTGWTADWFTPFIGVIGV